MSPRPTAYEAQLNKKHKVNIASNGINDLIEDFIDFLTVDLRFQPRTVAIHGNNLIGFMKFFRKNPLEVTRAEIRVYLFMRIAQKSQSTVNNDLKT